MLRFFDTDELQDPKVRALGSVGRDLLHYVRSYCDKAGLIRPEWDVVQLRLGIKLSQEEALNMLGGFVFNHPGGAWQLIGWFAQQYPKATRERCNGVASAALEMLDRAASLLGPQVLVVAGVPGCFPKSSSSGATGGGATLGVAQGDGDEDVGGNGVGNSAKPKGVSSDFASFKGGEFDAFTLVLDILRMTFKAGGLEFNEVSPPRLMPVLKDRHQKYGTDRVKAAARLYCENFNPSKAQMKSVRNWIENIDTWISQAPIDKTTCAHADLKFKITDLDEYKHGKKESVESCAECGHRAVKPIDPACPDHDFVYYDYEKENANAKKMGIATRLLPIEICKHCGERRDKMEAAA